MNQQSFPAKFIPASRQMNANYSAAFQTPYDCAEEHR
jgi:hypothetical protein